MLHFPTLPENVRRFQGVYKWNIGLKWVKGQALQNLSQKIIDK